MNQTEFNAKLLAAYPDRQNDYEERKNTVNDGDEPQPVELLLYSLAPKRKIHLLRQNEKRIREDWSAFENLLSLSGREEKETLSVLFDYLKQEGLLEEASSYRLSKTAELRNEQKLAAGSCRLFRCMMGMPLL